MERLPSTLLYLVIFNPTLNPDLPTDNEDEDAQEQAHILFYTSKYHATSRDIMLRQVGLARALIEFSRYTELFYVYKQTLTFLGLCSAFSQMKSTQRLYIRQTDE